MDKIKDFLLHKLTLRVVYIITAFSSAKIVSFAASSQVQNILNHAGVMFQVTDPEKLKLYIQGLVLIVGEFIYRWVHTQFILPHVSTPPALPSAPIAPKS